VNLSPRSSIEDIFTDGFHANNRYPHPPFGRHQNQIPYFITSPPLSDDHVISEDDDDDDDVISLSTIPEVPSVLAGTLSRSEFMELGTTVGRRLRRQRAAENHDELQNNVDNEMTADRDGVVANNSSSGPVYANLVTPTESRDVKMAAARRRRLTMLLMSLIVIFFVVLVAVIVSVVVILGLSLSLSLCLCLSLCLGREISSLSTA